MPDVIDFESITQSRPGSQPALATTTRLVDGLGGATGSHYVAATRQLYFVEFDGKVSVLDLVRRLDTVVFEGDAELPSDSSLGIQDGTSDRGGDIRWDRDPATGQLVLRPQGSSQLSYLGLVDYDSLSHTSLQGLSFGPAPLSGEGPEAQIVDGAVFAVHNTSRTEAANWDYAKFWVALAGADPKVHWVAYRLQPRYRVLATQYEQPMDIVLASDGRHAYVTEATGNLLRIDLARPKRGNATLVTSGLETPHQLALDEARSMAYVVAGTQAGGSSHLVRIDLATGATAVVTKLTNALGVVVTRDGSTAYVSQQTGGPGSICRVTLANGRREELPVALGLSATLAWGANGESTVVTADIATRELVFVDTASVPATATRTAALPPAPVSVAVVSPTTALVCCDQVIVQVDLAAFAFSGIESLLHGIGHVPRTKISPEGYATTDPGYQFRVKDAPFGGTLPVLFDHHQAYSMGARYYQILVDGAVQANPWSDDLRINENLSRLTPAAMVGQFFRVRPPGEEWHNPRLCYLLNTAGGRVADGRRTLEVRIFRSPDPSSEILTGGNTLDLMIDNQLPHAKIRQINHHDASRNPAVQPVSTCGIVQGHSDLFSFDIEAHDPVAHHLGGWSLSVVWGDNRSTRIAGDTYEDGHVAGAPHQWTGVNGSATNGPWQARVDGDETSIKCAHTFQLSVWDRVIDGWNRIHSAGYTRSITLLLAPPLV